MPPECMPARILMKTLRPFEEARRSRKPYQRSVCSDCYRASANRSGVRRGVAFCHVHTFAGCWCRYSSCTDEPFAAVPPEPPDEHWHSMVAPCFASDASICRDRGARSPQAGFRLP